jgi:Zn-dependent protease
VSGTVQIGRLFGVSVRVHFSWVFVFGLVALSLANSYLPDAHPGWSERQYWAIGIAGSGLLFLCVLAHEFSHSIEAMRRGREVSSITLFLLGGVSEIEEESRSAGEEFWVSFVGPATSLLLALLFWLLYLVIRSGNPQLIALVQYLAVVNLIIGLFNLVPAFPLDGGRVLRALVWRMTGNEARATTIASRVGSAFGAGFLGFGVAIIFLTDNVLAGVWMGIVGWFIRSSASSARQRQADESGLAGRRVRDAMRADFPTIEPGTSVQLLLERHMAREFERAYVVALGDTLYGLVTIQDVRRVAPDARARTWVSEAMTRVSDLATLSPDASLSDGLEPFLRRGVDPVAVVVEEDGRPVGLLSRQDILRVMEVTRIFPEDEVEPPAGS